MTKHKAMRYTVIRFMPYIQTREFANIGIIAACPKTGYFNYQIEHHYQRLSQFFQHFDSHIYRAAIATFSQELNHIKIHLENATSDQIRVTLDDLTQFRETIIQTSGIHTSLTMDEDEELQRLFAYYVHHSFAKKQPEERFTTEIVKMIKELNLINPFRQETLGDDEYHIVLPLVQKQKNEKISKIIKPLYLGQQDPSAIVNKADNWMARLKRLKTLSFLQCDTAILIPYLPPINANEKQNKALKMVLTDFQQQGIKIARQEEEKVIHQFALT